jgi:imidazole glycerol phosphate synthase glutamine amidotransferase subunit
MNAKDVGMIATEIANSASVVAGFRRLGVDPEAIDTAAEVSERPFVVLPGVGSFGHAMAMLHRQGLVAALKDRIQHNRPTLAICLGLQLLCLESEESPGVEGLGVIPALVRRLPPASADSREKMRIPHLGWNQVVPNPNCRYLQAGDAYFAHSYCVTEPVKGWQSATCDYGIRFQCAFERGNVLAAQFHPELSGRWGTELLRRWLDGREAGAC